ncbi:hypothetical protein GN956_G20655 [Arapaima gigas]
MHKNIWRDWTHFHFRDRHRRVMKVTAANGTRVPLPLLRWNSGVWCVHYYCNITKERRVQDLRGGKCIFASHEM